MPVSAQPWLAKRGFAKLKSPPGTLCPVLSGAQLCPEQETFVPVPHAALPVAPASQRAQFSRQDNGGEWGDKQPATMIAARSPIHNGHQGWRWACCESSEETSGHCKWCDPRLSHPPSGIRTFPEDNWRDQIS